MEPKDYIVVRIDGDYAFLRRTDINDPDLLQVARALLPEETDEGTKLHYEWMTYCVV